MKTEHRGNATASKNYTKPSTQRNYQGTITITAKAVGYVKVEELEEDTEIAPDLVNRALHGDTVEIALDRPVNGKRQSGKVVRVVERLRDNFVGTLEKDTEKGAARFFLVPDDKRIYVDFLIPDAETDGAREGYKAYVHMTEWDENTNPKAKILRILGPKGNNDTEMQAILLEKGLMSDFPPEVEAEAVEIKKTLAITPEEIAKRRDFRKVLTFTIDPADAKDFDDAISLQTLADGNYEVGVHIADVSHYLRPGSALDREAIKRGTSIYLVDRVIPMLPEILSNDLCSLNPNEDKLTFSAVFTLTPKGDIVDRWFGRTVIHSDKRFSYEEAQETLDAGAGTGQYFTELKTLNDLAHILREVKFAAGAIAFEQDEVKFELDASGKPLRVYKKERKDTHKLVEDFMLLANKEVAEYIYKLTKKGHPEKLFVYRIHDVPDPEKIAELSIFLKAIGYEFEISDDGVTAKDINALLTKIEGKAEEGLIKTATLRSMAKAIYSTKNIGHFGLAFRYYTHFTSPIRRYPDVMVHRLLDKHLRNIPITAEEISFYERTSIESTKKEIAAADAERTSIKYKQVEFMLDKIGQEFDGSISGVTEWGIYVEEVETRAEGMIRLKELGNDFFILDQKNYRLVGERTKKAYSLGEKVRIKLVAADLERKTLDFQIV